MKKSISKKEAKKIFRTIASKLNIKGDYISMENGGINATLISYQVKDKQYYVKIPKNRLVKTEVFFLDKLKKHGVKAPKIIYHDTSMVIIPYSFLIMERIEGGQSFKKTN